MKRLLLLLLCSANIVIAQSTLKVDPKLKPFYHGVASGDPLSDKVIIWTRITPDNINTSYAEVKWKMATDQEMTNVVKNGKIVTNPSKDFTVKIDVTGLSPNTFYYYQFEDEKKRVSVTGRTKTAPGNTDYNARLAMTSCAELEAGYFNVYKLISEKNDVDAVLCMGDYIYEYSNNGYVGVNAIRYWQPAKEITTLDDYRTRYSSYRLDSDLRRNHQLYPWICIWDDHESANDSRKDGASNHTEGKEGKWEDRKEWSKQAYFEWIPIRPVAGASDKYQIYRDISYGNNIDLIMLDTRLEGREKGNIFNKNKKLISDVQKGWMEKKLRDSDKKWKFLGQQVMMATVPILEMNADQWVGYKNQRKSIRELGIDNLVVLTGDIHSSWAMDLTEKFNGSSNYKTWGVEMVTPSVTSPGLGLLGAVTAPYIKYKNGDKHGFVLLDIDNEKVQGDWYHMNTITKPSTKHSVAASWKTLDRKNKLQNAINPTPSPKRLTDVPQPPATPKTSAGVIDQKAITVLSLYPNPVDEFLTIQYDLQENGKLSLQLIDINGKVIKQVDTKKTSAVWTERYPTADVASGVYILKLSLNGKSSSHKLIVKH